MINAGPQNFHFENVATQLLFSIVFIYHRNHHHPAAAFGGEEQREKEPHDSITN